MVLIRCDTQLTTEFFFAQNVAIEQRKTAFRAAIGVNPVRRSAKTRMSSHWTGARPAA
jgi:hypothetical protein